MAKRVVDVLVPVALDRAYSYRVPETLSLAPGDIVSVPLGCARRDGGGVGGQSETDRYLHLNLNVEGLFSR